MTGLESMKRALDSESASRAEDSSTLDMPVPWGDHQVEHQGQWSGASQSLEDKLPTLCGQAREVTQVLTASQVLVSFGPCIQVSYSRHPLWDSSTGPDLNQGFLVKPDSYNLISS